MDASTGLAIFQAAFHLAGLLVDERDRQKAAAIQIELTDKLMQAQAAFGELLAADTAQKRLIAALEDRMRELQAQVAQKQRYVLAELGTGGQFFVYRPCPGPESEQGVAEVAHFACQPCFEGGKLHVLRHNGGGYWWCPVCKHGADVGDTSHGSAVLYGGGGRDFSDF